MNSSMETAFKLISIAGEARSITFEAMQKAKDEKFEESNHMLAEAEVLLNSAHKIQFELISQETSGNLNIELSFIMVHAQDHLMTAILANELIREIIQNKVEIYQLKQR